MKEILKKYWWLLLIVIIIPFVLNFVLLIPVPISNRWIVGDPSIWLSFWVSYFSVIGTFCMVFITYKTLLQNNKLIKEQSIPKLSCSLVVESGIVGIEIKNTSSVSAHGVKMTLTNHSETKIYNFDGLCNLLENMRFDIPALGVKFISIDGIEPYRTGKYEGYITATIVYDDKQESFDLFLSEINIIAWKHGFRDVEKKLDEIKDTLKCNN